jgi:sporulation protein YlmC with PRC-barrel domain
MKKTSMVQTAIATVTLFTGLAVMAQAPNAPDRTQNPGQKDKMAGKEQSSMKLELRRASKIDGLEVQASDNEKVGKINNLAIDLDSGRVIFAVVSSGGVLGVGDKLAAVPFKALHFGDLNNVAKLTVDKATFDSAPKLDKDSWNNLNDRTWRTTAYKHYKLDVNWDAPLDVRTGEMTIKTETERPATNIVKSTEAIGMDVHNTQNDNLGDINDLVIDVNRAQVVYTVLGFGGVLGVGEKLFAVPWQSLKLDRADKKFVLNVDKDKLKNAPGFDRDKWPDMTDTNWSQNIYAFYGAQPDWVYGYSGQGNTEGNVKSTGWEADSAYNRMFNGSKVSTFTGKITNVDHVTPMSGMSEGVQLTVQTDKGETKMVHLGPAWFVDQQNVKFNTGDTVTITASDADIQGKPVCIATEVKANNQTVTLRNKTGQPAWNTNRPNK